ncbi:MAG TPA: sensor histidine kinase [Terriglobales bacterium]|nr:sensor histidine kinase [Terriglobales bacterium]
MSSLTHKFWKPVPHAAVPEGFEPELSRHLVRAQEEERKRISRELHDGTGQGLMVLRLYLGMLGAGSQDTESQLKVQEALGLLDRTIEDLRRIIGRLSPRTLEELGVLTAIRKEARELSRNTGMKARLDLPKTAQELDHEAELAVYRCVQEALHNIAKHSKAENFSVRLRTGNGRVRLMIEDDGVGFSPRRSPRDVFGLSGMRERITALGGTVRVRTGNGKGTQITVTLPSPAPGELLPATQGGSRLAADFVRPWKSTA